MYKPSLKIYAKNLPKKGLGVFASRNINSGEIIETCPIIYLDSDFLDSKTILNDYCFLYPISPNTNKDQNYVIAWGFGSLYNHSSIPNSDVLDCLDDECVNFVAIKNIAKDEEISIDYGELWVNSRKNLQLV